jgi:hypothetical protein
MDGIRRLLFTLRQRQAADRGGLYPAAFGIQAEEFDQAFERYLREQFPSASLIAPAPLAEGTGRRLIGQKISEQLKTNTASNVTVDTLTLSFGADAEVPAYTIDFITEYAFNGATHAAGAVDIVVTQWPAGDAAPQVAINVDGETQPLATRPRSRRSVVSTIPLEELRRFAKATSVVEHAFDTELEFSSVQLVMLRRIVDGWITRLER